MRKLETSLPDRYTSKDVRVSRSHTHADMWIIDSLTSNGFYCLHMTDTQMKLHHPPDDKKRVGKNVPVQSFNSIKHAYTFKL